MLAGGQRDVSAHMLHGRCLRHRRRPSIALFFGNHIEWLSSTKSDQLKYFQLDRNFTAIALQSQSRISLPTLRVRNFLDVRIWNFHLSGLGPPTFATGMFETKLVYTEFGDKYVTV